jgi:hypothetical protein
MWRTAQTKLLSLACGMWLAGCASPDRPVRGDAVIRAPAGNSEIVITTTECVAGAIHSLTWAGKEFIDSVDHGRQLQSASNFDAGVQPIQAETFNPTEAGSRLDHVGPKSTSRLLALKAGPRVLETTSQMAFWLAHGEKSGAHLARNATVLSNHLLEKQVRLGWHGMPHVIEYNVVFTVPAGEGHWQAVFEALTGYMPAEFSRFWRFDAASGEFAPLTDGPGEQSQPVVLATESGSHAMGIWSPGGALRTVSVRARESREVELRVSSRGRRPAHCTGALSVSPVRDRRHAGGCARRAACVAREIRREPRALSGERRRRAIAGFGFVPQRSP